MSLTLIASYPKSGNTWMRVFLESYSTGTVTDINSKSTPSSADRSLFQEHCGISSTDFTPEESNQLRTEVYRSIRDATEGHAFLKVHDLPTPKGLFPPEVRVIYLVRNPLDVLVSATDFFSFESDKQTTLFMKDRQAGLAAREGGINVQMHQKLGSWSHHVNEWLNGDHDLTVHVCRYEDMYDRPEETFGAAVDFLGYPQEPERLKQALQNSQFSNLQRAENEQGFHGRAPSQKRFFRRGRPGAGNSLPEAIRKQIFSDHGKTMQQLGYL